MSRSSLWARASTHISKGIATRLYSTSAQSAAPILTHLTGLNITPLPSNSNSKIAHVQLAHPPVNAFTPTLLASLKQVIPALESENYKGIVLSSNSHNVFSAGLDLNQLLIKKGETEEEFKERFEVYMGSFQEAMRNWVGTEMVVAAVVRGMNPAGGTVSLICPYVYLRSNSSAKVLSLTCDHRIAPATLHPPQKFLMGLNETAVGMSPPMWVLELAKSSLKSHRLANKLVVEGALVHNPQKALEVGWVDELVEAPAPSSSTPVSVEEDPLMKAAISEIERILRVPWKARVETKRASRDHILSLLASKQVPGSAGSRFGLGYVYESVRGEEFQRVVGGILEELKSKGKKKKN
ncbi:Crotonase/enoyl-CoA hydratase protein [Chytridiales sp. JEL 0842]|nr:Crotonase/enoyl-CoA hydratase protein [Chytridiales sp. JEL 0842]